jgi:hypothetical protein
LEGILGTLIFSSELRISTGDHPPQNKRKVKKKKKATAYLPSKEMYEYVSSGTKDA